MAGSNLARTQTAAERLIKELGCPACHSGFGFESDLRDNTPNLSWAGVQYNPAYLFDYLQNPAKVRQHIGKSRMPDFGFTQTESLALVLFLEQQRHLDPEWPEIPSGSQGGRLDTETRKKAEELIVDRLACTNCHALGDEGTTESIDLSTLGYRLTRAWTKNYLAAPQLYDGQHTTMPSYFFQLAASRDHLVEILPNARKTIDEIVDFLFLFGREARDKLKSAFDAAQKSNPGINAEMGEKIFRSQNCVACHHHVSIVPWRQFTAPDLSIEGSRVTDQWLKTFLTRPSPIRPFGFFPGSGSRMPDFRLAAEEIQLLHEYLLKQRPRGKSPGKTFQTTRVSEFAGAKARALLLTRLSCLGCHRLGGEGGRIGPDLSNLKSRLQPDFVYRFIQEPQQIIPETVMPRIPMPPKTLELIVNYLVQQELPKEDTTYLSPLDHEVHFGDTESWAYSEYCASCHGTSGDGKGYNAQYLPIPPTDFSDQAYLSQRPDDTLFDGIFAGGYILSKSHFMPAWGETLEGSEIRELVSTVRGFCGCEGPPWSRDNK